MTELQIRNLKKIISMLLFIKKLIKWDNRNNTYGEVSKKLMPRRNASRTAATASFSETAPKTLPSGEAPKPTQLRRRPVLPNGRSSNLRSGNAI